MWHKICSVKEWKTVTSPPPQPKKTIDEKEIRQSITLPTKPVYNKSLVIFEDYEAEPFLSNDTSVPLSNINEIKNNMKMEIGPQDSILGDGGLGVGGNIGGIGGGMNGGLGGGIGGMGDITSELTGLEGFKLNIEPQLQQQQQDKSSVVFEFDEENENVPVLATSFSPNPSPKVIHRSKAEEHFELARSVQQKYIEMFDEEDDEGLNDEKSDSSDAEDETHDENGNEKIIKVTEPPMQVFGSVPVSINSHLLQKSFHSESFKPKTKEQKRLLRNEALELSKSFDVPRSNSNRRGPIL